MSNYWTWLRIFRRRFWRSFSLPTCMSTICPFWGFKLTPFWHLDFHVDHLWINFTTGFIFTRGVHWLSLKNVLMKMQNQCILFYTAAIDQTSRFLYLKFQYRTCLIVLTEKMIHWRKFPLRHSRQPSQVKCLVYTYGSLGSAVTIQQKQFLNSSNNCTLRFEKLRLQYQLPDFWGLSSKVSDRWK